IAPVAGGNSWTSRRLLCQVHNHKKIKVNLLDKEFPHRYDQQVGQLQSYQETANESWNMDLRCCRSSAGSA
ncbi:MAG: hypothetical protein ACRD88_19185, partial [Terriglobia bacterium]